MLDKHNSNIVDVDKIILRYPGIKDEETEYKVPIVKNDIIFIADEHSAINYFSNDWRFDNNIIDCVASKYSGKVDDYPETDDESSERFLIGVEAIKGGRSISCPYLKKAFEVLDKDKRIRRSSIIAIHLLNICKREENSQKFLLLTKDKVYVRYNTNRLEEYDYDDVVFLPSGVVAKSQLTDIEGFIVDYPICRDFQDFVQEYQLLRSTMLQDVDEIHPVMELTYENKIKYLYFLIDVSVNDGKITAEKLLRLEFLARAFKIESDKFVKQIVKSAKTKTKKQSISKIFTDILLNVLTAELRFVFYQDILELTVNMEGETDNPDLQRLMKDRKYAGSEFIRQYTDFIKYRKRAEKELTNSILEISNSCVRGANIFPMQKFNSSLNLKLLEIGVMINGQK